jgi:hypothetical protein
MNKQFAQIAIGRLKLTAHLSATTIWYRRRGRGWAVTRSPLSFSERRGLKKFRQLPCGWRLQRLPNIPEV